MVFWAKFPHAVVKYSHVEARAQRLRPDRIADGLCKCAAMALGPCADQ